MYILIPLLISLTAFISGVFLELHKEDWTRKNGVQILRNHFKYEADIPNPPYYKLLSFILMWIFRLSGLCFIVMLFHFLYKYLMN